MRRPNVSLDVEDDAERETKRNRHLDLAREVCTQFPGNLF